MSTTHTLRALLLLLVINSPVHAESFWAHRITTQVNLAYGDDTLQTMDVFMHGSRLGEPNWFAEDTAPRPTLMWIHGGGWVAGDKASATSQLIPYLERGWNVFNVNYRQGANTAPQAVDDVMCAYKLITENLAERGQPTNQIVVSGASAGGHLALVVGLLNARSEHPCRVASAPHAVVNWFGITDIEMVDEYLQEQRPDGNYARTWAGSRDVVTTVSDAYSPMYLISDDAPPIITIHGTADSIVPFDQAESLHASLTTPNELVVLDGGNHSGFSEAQYQEAYRKIFSFLDAH
jgi:acetyl esterase/lipase